MLHNLYSSLVQCMHTELCIVRALSCRGGITLTPMYDTCTLSLAGVVYVHLQHDAMPWLLLVDLCSRLFFTCRLPAGRIVTVETMSVPVINQRIDTVRTNWSESSNKDYDHVFIIRVFYTQDECAREHVGRSVSFNLQY